MNTRPYDHAGRDQAGGRWGMGGLRRTKGSRGMDFGRISAGQVISRDAAPWADGADYGVMKVIVYLQVRSIVLDGSTGYSQYSTADRPEHLAVRSAVTSAQARTLVAIDRVCRLRQPM
jgi:hypothetical protein